MVRGAFFSRDDSETSGVYAEAERRVREASLEGKVSNRRYKRWVNDRLLRELAPPMDSLEIGDLFAPPPWGEKDYQTPFEQVTEMGSTAAAAAWEPFSNNVDMDYQAEVLRQLREVRYPFAKNDAAFTAWRTVDHNARDALKRNSESLFLDVLEEKVLEFVSEGKEDELVVEVAAPQHRLLLHGLSQFHGLVSRTSAPPPTTVRISKPSKCKDAAAGRDLNLRKFLRSVRQPATVV